MDLVAHTRQIPVPGQTVIGTGFDTTPGGKGANQAVAAARLGYPVNMVGAVGEDVFGQALLDNLAKAGVDTAAVARVSGPSGVAPILVADNGENSSSSSPAQTAKWTAQPSTASPRSSAPPAWCSASWNCPFETVSHTLALCAEAGVPVMLDPAPAAPLPDTVFHQVTWFTPNETEAAFYLGNQSRPEEAAQQLSGERPQRCSPQARREGAYVAVAGGKAAWVKPFPVQAVDTVAAGDCFNGAFAVALLEGNDPWAAARFASAAAAISVTRRGAQASMPSRAEVDAFLAQHG